MRSTLRHIPFNQSLFTPEQCQALDRQCIDEFNIDGYELMQQAAQGAFGVLLSEWPNVNELIVLCGKGNNGGDGFEMASLAQEHGMTVQLVFDGQVQDLKGEAKQAALSALDKGLVPIAGDQVNWARSNTVIVDGLLGTGTQGAPRGNLAHLITQANASGLPILAVDIPSGLNGLTGYAAGVCIKAHTTVTMLLNKQGLHTGDAGNVVGQVRLAHLNTPKAARSAIEPASALCNWQTLSKSPWFQPRPLNSHKGHFGHALLIGGDHGMAGAISLAASAALRSGAGLVSVATRTEHVPIVVGRQPEVMAHGIETAAQLQALIENASVIAIGPGLGKGPWGQQMLQQVMQSNKPVVLDADALNLIAKGTISHNLAKRISVLTPHPGEAARLLGVTTQEVGQDRFASAQTIGEQFHSIVVLKGAGTLISQGHDINICHDGNPGMASGGMGDVLTGVMVGIMAQHETDLADHGLEIVTAATCLHSAAADEAAKQGQVSLLASDLLETLRQLLN